MSDDRVYTEAEINERIAKELPGWELREGWLRRSYTTPGFAHTLLLANTIGYIAEAAWHHQIGRASCRERVYVLV